MRTEKTFARNHIPGDEDEEISGDWARAAGRGDGGPCFVAAVVSGATFGLAQMLK
jgi:hypothetical protein